MPKSKAERGTKKPGRPAGGVPAAFKVVAAVDAARFGAGTIRERGSSKASSLETGKLVRPKPRKAAYSDAETNLKNRGLIKDRKSDGMAPHGTAAKKAYSRAKKMLKGTPFDRGD